MRLKLQGKSVLKPGQQAIEKINRLRSGMVKSIDKVKAALRRERVKEPIRTSDLLSWGATLLDLLCTGRTNGGLVKGKIHHFVGDSDTGKSFFGLTCLAEACLSEHFKGYRLVHDSPEGLAISLPKFFPVLTERIEQVSSDTVDEFYYRADDLIRKGKPFILVLDDMDSLSSKAERKKFKQEKRAYEKGTEVPGSYGDGKAKKNSNLRLIKAGIKRTGSIVLIISQTRDNLAMFSAEGPKVFSGGRALKFYSHLQLWSSPRGKELRTHNKKDRQAGIKVKVEVRKNHITGRMGSVEVPIHWSGGIDNVGSVVDFLIEEKGLGWLRKELGFGGTRDVLAARIDREGKHGTMKALARRVWEEIENAIKVERTNRYATKGS